MCYFLVSQFRIEIDQLLVGTDISTYTKNFVHSLVRYNTILHEYIYLDTLFICFHRYFVCMCRVQYRWVVWFAIMCVVYLNTSPEMIQFLKGIPLIERNVKSKSKTLSIFPIHPWCSIHFSINILQHIDTVVKRIVWVEKSRKWK